MEFKEAQYYGIYGHTICPSLITPDKQLHAGPGPVQYPEELFWDIMGNMLNFFERNCPDETFTLVLDVSENFEVEKEGE